MSLGVPRTPNYVLTSPWQVKNQSDEYVTLPGGTFVRPILLKYLPAHVLERFPNASSDDVFCYTHYGIVPIPKRIIRET